MKRRDCSRFRGSLKAANRLRTTAVRLILASLCLLALGMAVMLWPSRMLPVGAASPAQESKPPADSLWQEITETAEMQGRAQSVRPGSSRTLRLNREALTRLLSQAPLEFTEAARQTQIVLPLPLPEGTLAHFRLEESPALVPELAAQYPEIKSYIGQGIDDPTLTMRCDLSPQGFHAAIITNEQMITIHPQADDVSTYVSYSDPVPGVACDVKELESLEQLKSAAPANLNFGQNFAVGATLRRYRIGISTTQEYTNDPRFGGGTVAGAMASITTWINGVNAVYEREFSIRLLVMTNNALIFTAEPDGYTNGVQGTMLNEVRPKLRDLLGAANYDLGHVLGTSGNGGAAGVATLGGVCDSSPGDPLGPRKGQGATVFNVPPGSSLGVAVLTHEIGHMFSAGHTYNTRIPDCDPDGPSAWEPGGGSTVMAGGCGADRLTPVTQIRFHVGSKIQVNNYLSSTIGSSCGMPIATGNNPPNVSGGPDFTIPKFTPFTLTATGSDPDVNDLPNHTYIWEQMDAGNGEFEQDGTEASFNDARDESRTTRPIFRVFLPTASPARTFPSLTYILNNANDPPDFGADGFRIAEELPRIGRTLNFRVTLSDNRAGGSGVTDDLVTLTVAANAGPFLITAPNTGAAWTVGSRQTVNWSVSNTNAAPINAGSVRILLSTDGGLTFPIVLAAATPNDGIEDITVPNGLNTTTARLKVEAIGNIFFDISDVNFAISAGPGCPLITSAAPNAGNAGTNVTINGRGFTGITAVRFGGNVAAANFTVVSDTQLTATVPAGAVTGPLMLSKANCPDVALAAFTVCTNAPETLQVDDGSPNDAFSAGGYYFNRLTPTNYPATLRRVAIRFAEFQQVPTGTPLTIMAGANTDGDANIDNTAFQTVGAQVGALGPFVSYDLAKPLTINSGDFVVGYRLAPSVGGLHVLRDKAVLRNRSYTSGDGVRFEAHATGNFLIRAEFLRGCGGGLTCPTVTDLSATNGTPGSTVTITGTNFTDVTAVRFGANAAAVFTINSSTQITATVPANAATGPLTLSRVDCPDAQTANFTVVPLTCPTVTGLNPANAAPGSAIAITGTNLTGVAVLKFANEVSANFTVNSDTQITATVPAGAVTGPITISKTGCADLQTATFTVGGGCPTITINPATLPDGNVNGAYNQPLTATGGTVPYTFSLTAGTPVTTGFNAAGPVAIPDNNPAGVDLPVTVSGITSPITKVTVSLHITHTFDGDLRLQLIGPDGTTVNLSNNRGAGGDNYGSACLPEGQRTLFDDAAATAIGAGTVPFIGSFRPEQVLSAFNGKAGAAVNGAWRLRVVDGANEDTGSIQCASVFITQTLPAPGLSLATNGTLSGTPTTAGTFNFTVRATDANQCTGDRTYALTIRTGNFGQRIVEQNGTFVADFKADSPANNEEIVVTPTSNPALRAGTYSIAVANYGHGAANFTSTGTLFAGTQTSAPVLTSLDPSSVTAGGAALPLTVTGANFLPDSVVRWNGQDTTTTFVSAKELKATIPALAIAQVGTANVTVFNPSGPAVSNAASFTITPTLMTSVSAASFAPDSTLTPNAITAAFGQRLATATQVADSQPLPTSLAGTSVRIRDAAGVERLAPLFFVSAGQINYLVPADTADGKATVTVTSDDETISQGTINVLSVAPGLFAANSDGQGVPAAVALRVRGEQQTVEAIARFDPAQNRFVATPLDLGPKDEQVFLILFGTGFRNRTALTAVDCAIGGASAEVLFAGAVEGLAGLDQANVLIPHSLSGRGNVDLIFRVDGRAANTVTINIK